MISISTAAKNSQHGAQNNIAGVLSNGAAWYQTISLTDENGSPLTGVNADTWQFQFRCSSEDTSTILALSTTDGVLTVTEGADSTTMLINAPQSSLASMDGDYTVDLVSKAVSDGRLTHRAHGIVTFRNDPIAF